MSNNNLLQKDLLLTEEELNLNLHNFNLNSDIKDIFKKCTLIKEIEHDIIEQNKRDIISTLNIMKEYIMNLKVILFF